MSNVINFSAREFRFDKTCEDNTGIRAVITTSQGNTEAYEIGDWSWSWTQIFCDKKLEKNTDYIFRFAMTGGHNDTDDEVSLAEIYALDGYDDPTSAWEDRMTFALGKSRYAPVISKRDRTGLLRVFEIPFNTGDSENWRFVLIAQHAVAAFFAPLENSAYDGLEDLTYEQWREERTAQLRDEKSIWNKPTGNKHSSSHFNDIVSYIKEATDFASKIKVLSKKRLIMPNSPKRSLQSLSAVLLTEISESFQTLPFILTIMMNYSTSAAVSTERYFPLTALR